MNMKTLLLATTLASTSLTGCMGQMGMTQMVADFNMNVVKHRWAREGIFVGLTVVPVYELSMLLDVAIFNSIEFWTGTNPLTKKRPARVDQASLDTEAVSATRLVQHEDGSLDLLVTFRDDSEAVLAGTREGDTWLFRQDGAVVGYIPAARIDALLAAHTAG